MKTVTYRIVPLLVLAAFPSCSQTAGPADEQVSRDIISFLQEKCEPLGITAPLRAVKITAVRVEQRSVADDTAEILATAEGQLDPSSAFRGYVFSDYCPVGSDHKSTLNVGYALRDGKWQFEGKLQKAGDTRTAANTDNTRSASR